MELTHEEIKILLECINAVSIPGSIIEKVVILKTKLNDELKLKVIENAI